MQILELVDKSRSNLEIYGKLAERTASKTLVCFMPAARSKRNGIDARLLSRFTWEAELQAHHVLALADPAMGIHEELKGAWYLHPTVDLIQELADLVISQVERLGLDNKDVLFYGSSLGGYGALSIASLLPGSTAIAEVPQIDVARWPIPSAIRNIENFILKTDFGNFRLANEEKIDLRARFMKSKLVPPYLIITNESDTSLTLQQEFHCSVKSLDVKRIGNQQLIMTEQVSGHKALPKSTVLAIIESWAENQSLAGCANYLNK